MAGRQKVDRIPGDDRPEFASPRRRRPPKKDVMRELQLMMAKVSMADWGPFWLRLFYRQTGQGRTQQALPTSRHVGTYVKYLQNWPQ